jgi:hypothetical protein
MLLLRGGCHATPSNSVLMFKATRRFIKRCVHDGVWDAGSMLN